MPQTRRTFLASSAVGAAGLAISPYAAYASLGRASKPLRILVLGGTGFIGPHIVEACRARGHTLTLFNRGKTEKVTGHDFAGTDGIDRRYGNRDPEKYALEDQEPGPDNPKGLSSLEEGEWDAVIDNSGYWPRIVGASAELLAPRVKQYLFISTVSVYDSYAEVGADTTASVGTMEDPTSEDFGASFENYGPAKALCEKAVERAMPGRALSLRPGLIVGPGDLTGRFTYWPVRVSRGGEMIAPGTPDDPIQMIDARDLATWAVHCIEHNVTGTFDAVGPPAPQLTIGKILDASKHASGADTTLTWCDAAFLEAQGVSPFGDMPLWMPPEGERAGFHQRDVSASIAAGLTFLPVSKTCKDTLDWYNGLAEGSRFRRLSGIDAEREAATLAAWHEQQG